MDSATAISHLNDLELAVLVCLVAKEHCIIRTPQHLLSAVGKKLESIARDIYDLAAVCIECGPATGIAELQQAQYPARDAGEEGSSSESKGSGSGSFEEDFNNVPKTTPNVLIACYLNEAPRPTQLAVLDMMRRGQIAPDASKGRTSKPFLVVALLADESDHGPLLTPHLNDYFFILHDVASLDVPANPRRPGLEPTLSSASLASFSSVIVNRPNGTMRRDIQSTYRPNISYDTIVTLQALAGKIHSTPEIRRYIHNIVTFLRLHRGVAGGVSALSSRHLALLAQILAALHGLTYLPPSVVALAARKVFTHRISIPTPETERSMQWGSSWDAVEESLRGLTAEGIVEDILAAVPSPI